MKNRFSICLLFLAAFWTEAEMCAARKRGQSASAPPPMPTLSCTAFPGSDEWQACFSKWNADVAAWKGKVSSYSLQQTQSSSEDANDGATSSMSLNGWKIRAFGCSVTSSSLNGHLNLSVSMPNVDEVKVEPMSSSTHTKRYSGYKKGQLQSWIKVTPPGGTPVESVKHSFTNNVLDIWGSN